MVAQIMRAEVAVPATTTVAAAAPQRMTLNTLPYGVAAHVVGVSGNSAITRRLMEMGVVPGASICVVKAAPLGDPIQVRVRGYHLALRRAEAQTISVVRAND